MVSSPSPSAVDERRRRSMLDKAKAMHLSRQLQLRLQYARLKVDHGWHKQNLNEVENLYFHHSHQRGPRSYPAGSVIATTQSEFPGNRNGISPAQPPQSSLSFKLGSSNSFSKSFSSIKSGDSDVRMEEASSAGASKDTQSTAVPVAPPSTSASQTTQSPIQKDQPSILNPSANATSIVVHPVKDATQAPASSTSTLKFSAAPSAPVSYPTSSYHVWPSTQTITSTHTAPISVPSTSFTPTMHLSSRAQQKQPAMTFSTHPIMTTTSQPRTSMMNVMPAYPASVSNPSTQQPTASTSSLTSTLPVDPFGSPSANTLTYDSFWSSHTSTKRPISFRASLTSLTASALRPGSGVGGSGVSTGSTSSTMSAGVTSVTTPTTASFASVSDAQNPNPLSLAPRGVPRRNTEPLLGTGYATLGPPFEPSGVPGTTGYAVRGVPGVGVSSYGHGAGLATSVSVTPTAAPAAAAGVSSHA